MDPENAAIECTDYAARAKALLRRTAQAGALVIIPLALAFQAHAAVMLPALESCHVAGGQDCTAASAMTQLPALNGVEGVQASLGGLTSFAMSSSGGTSSLSLSMMWSGGLTMDSGGDSCDGPGNPCDVSALLFNWSAGFEAVSGGGSSGGYLNNIISSYFDTYFVSISLDGANVFSESLPASVFGPNVGGSGSATIPIPVELRTKIHSLVSGSSGGDVNFGITFSFSYDAPSGAGQVVPDAFVSVTAAQTAPPGVPEPATTGLLSGGLLGLGAWLRRRRRA